MALFLSTYVNKVDRKGRVSIPAQFRAALGEQAAHGIFLFRSLQLPALEACSAAYMERLSASLDDPALPDDQRELLETAIFGASIQLSIDGEGRVLLPQDFAAYATISEDAAFVGVRRTFQIWEPSALQAHSTRAREQARGQAISLSSILARTGASGAAP